MFDRRENHCTGHQCGIDSRTVIIKGKATQDENVGELSKLCEFLWDVPFKLFVIIH